MKIIFLITGLFLVSVACSVGPQPIHYGEDNCILCEMTIMDRRYGTEIVTNKGKAYKFDSVECLVDYLKKNEQDSAEFKFILVTPFNQPGKLVDAAQSYVLHSKNLPSPMGLFLTAFESEATALQYKDEFGGRVYCWKRLNKEFDFLGYQEGE